MANNSLRYSVTQYGSFAVETIIDTKTEEVFIGRPALEKIAGWRPDSGREKLASKSLKTFAGNALAVGKKVTGIDSLGRQNTIIVIPFQSALTALYWELKNDNPNVERLLLAGFADSFTSQAFEQAGLEYSLEKRKELLAFYLTDYHELFDWIRDTYVELYGVKPPHSVYQAINKAINLHLFGKVHFSANRKKNATNREIRDIENCQMFVMRKINQANLKGDPLNIVPDLVRQF